MHRSLLLAAFGLLVQSHVSAQEAFDGWPESKVTVYCGTMAVVNRYINKSEDGQLPPMTEDQRYWWDKTQALFPDAATRKQAITLASEEFEVDYLKASNNETNPKVTRPVFAELQGTRCSIYHTQQEIYHLQKQIKEQEAVHAQAQQNLAAAEELKRRKDAEASISFDELPFVNIEMDPGLATLEVYFSLGCNHCLLFLDQHLVRLFALAVDGRINLRLLEVPNLVPNRTRDAVVRTSIASCYAAYAAKSGPVPFMSFVSQLIGGLKNNLTNTETRTWEFYPYSVASDFGADSPYRSVETLIEDVAQQAGLEPQSCDRAFLKERIEQTYAIVKALKGKVDVPFYRFNGRYYYDSREHEQLIIDVQTYVDSLREVSP